MATGSVSHTMCQSVSPAKPDNDATEPKEEATYVHTHLFSKPDAEKVVTALQCRDEVSSIKVEDKSYSGLLTKEMIEEEKRLEEEGEQELEHQRKEQDRLWEQLDESNREQRYQRLQFLLQRSNLYTEYLINRMKQQQEEEVKRKKRRAQKQAKQEQRQQDGQEKQEAENTSAHENLQEMACLRQRKRKEMEEVDENSAACADEKAQEAKRLKITGPSVESAGENNSVESSSSDAESLEGEKTTDQEQVLDTLNADDKPREFNGEPVPEDQPVLLTGGVLRPYQIEGFLWLKTLYENGVNGILADEMGLGKTVQCVAMFAHLVYMGVRGPFLVCAPLSTIPNWFAEFQRFAPKVPVMLYHGNKEERHGLRIKIAELHEVREGVKVHPCVITSYEVAMMDQRFLQKCEWQYFIVDEGHRIKNTHCRLIRALRMYKTTNRLLVTGTPLQNNLSELWSLLNFLLPEIFDDLGSFEAWFDVEHIGDGSACKEIAADEQRKNVLSMLHQILTPFMLRRLKTDVDLRIPPKKEVLVYAPLQPLQQEFYAALIDKTIFSKIEGKNGRTEKVEVRSNGRPVRRTTKVKIDYKLMMADSRYEKAPKTRRRVEQEDEELEGWVQSLIEMQQKRQCRAEPEQKVSQLSIKLRNVMMQLRKCCSHPFLLEHPLNPKTGELCLDERIVTESGKMMVLDCMLKELKKRGHKVLIFSQMTKMLDLLEDYCQLRNFGYCRLDGSMNINNRKENMQEFQNNPESFIFLLSTRAGGLGINLTAADTVIIYDSDWNPQCDLQAQDRCHRIGQMRPVMVYRLVTANTIDQRIVERAAAKRKLEKLVIHQGKFKSGMKNFKTSLEPISSEELLALLNSKDYESEVKGSNGQEVMSRTELDQLLDRSDLEARWTANLQGVKSGAKSEDRPLCFPLDDLLCTLGSAPRRVQQKRRQGDRTCRASKSTEGKQGCKDETIPHQPLFKVIDIDDGDSIPGGSS